MHNHFRRAFVAVVAALCSVSSLMATTPQPGVVRVKLQPEVARQMTRQRVRAAAPGKSLTVGIAPLDASLRQIKGVEMRPVFPCSPDRAAEHAKFGLDRWYEITFDNTINPLEAKRVLSQTAGIEKADARKPMKLLEDAGRYREHRVVARANESLPMNDGRLSLQWHYHNDGSMEGSVPGADINLFKAWQITTGNPNVVVAIIDGGVDYTHEDLAANMWVNEAELNGQPGVDDDGDGYIDDIYGYNFCANNGAIYPHNHGTHVAGTVAAVNNNGLGVCGVAGGNGLPNSGVKLMSAQVFDSRNNVGPGDFAAAIVYAADKGAVIAQCSWGWEEDGYYEADVLDAIRYFTHSARSGSMTGGLCIFAAGNEGLQGHHYPGAWDEVVAVGSMMYDLTPAPYSNHGPWVDVTAPGGLMDFDEAQGVLSTLPGNKYGYSEGTSMATPHVSGIAALVLSKYGSSTMVTEALRQQLVTSVNDFYTKNPAAAGLFGSGYIDAYKALQWANGEAPAAVSDLSAIAAQDNATLTWTIPAANGDNVNSHIIYYSTEPFDAQSDLTRCKSIAVDTKFYQSGDKFTYDVNGLDALTTYYFGVVAVDRWSSASPLSNVVMVTTNEGPSMTLSRTACTIRTYDGSTWTSPAFEIGNTKEGVLKWSASLNTLSSNISPYAAAKGLITTPFRGRMTAEQASQGPVEAIESFEQEDFPQAITNAEQLLAYIGELDQTARNSMAQMFTVDADEYPDGFNLTHIYMMGGYGLNPVIEVYKNGGTLSRSTLLSTTKITSTMPYYTNLQLAECYHFAPGESFYIVVHFTEYNNRNYPLGLGISNGSAAAAQSYFSYDGGETWSLLSEALRGSTYEEYASRATWCITAKSLFPDWSQILTLTPAEGRVFNGETQTVTISHNGTRVPNGSYRARIHFDTNESNPSGKTVNININADGQKPEVAYNKIVQFGNVLVGQSKTLTIEVTNRGFGAFSGSSQSAGIYSDKIASTSEHFFGPEYLPNGIPSRSTVRFDLTYAPKSAGSHNGQIVISDKDGNTLKVNVQGSATDPAKIVTDPASIEVGDLDATTDATKDVTFDIRNEGNYPLQFTMPKYTTETLDEIASGSTHRFGYTWQSNLYGSSAVAYDGVPQLLDAVDVSGDFSDYVYFSRPIDIGFDFPFYGKTYSKLYISSFGMLTFDTYDVGLMYSPVDEANAAYLADLGVISAYGFQVQTNPNTRIEYAKQDGKFVVNFSNVLVTVYDTEVTAASFHIILSPNGDIQISYDKYSPDKVFEKGRHLWAGIVDPAMDDPLTVTSSRWSAEAVFRDNTDEEYNRWRHIATGTSFVFSAPQPDMIRSIEPTWGIVAPGDKVEVKATVGATDDMYAGANLTKLVILSNDIVNPTAIVDFRANIVGDLNPALTVGVESLDFGKVFRTATAQLAVSVKNSGRSAMTLDGVTVANGRFTHNFTAPIAIEAGQSKDVIITLPTVSEGVVTDQLTITTSAGSATVALRGEVIGAPAVGLSYDKLTATFEAGTNQSAPLTVTNTGDEPLRYSIVPGAHVSFNPAYESGSSTAYAYESSLDNPTARREWVDIETNGLGKQLAYTYFLNRDVVAVDLPFEFPFYNKKYSKMYIYNSGFVSFNQYNDDGIWPEPPGDFPDGTPLTNIIAPYWGLHTMDITSTAGVYYWVGDDEAVVSYIEYGNSMNIGVDFQLVIRADGTFTFNYKPAFEYAMIFAPFGISGISNDGASEGICLPERYIALNSTVNFQPVVSSTLEPGESRQADITLLGDAFAGRYKSSIRVNTNVPTASEMTIPVDLTLTGEPKPVWPDNVVVEHVESYRDTNTSDPLIGYYGMRWYAPIEIANEGNAAFTIKNIDIQCPKVNGVNQFSLFWYGTYIDDWMGTEATGWTTYKTNTAITVTNSPLRLAIPINPGDYSIAAWNTPGEYDIKLTLTVSGLPGVTKKEIDVKLIVTDRPILALDREEIRVAGLNDDDVATETFRIANNGKYPLQFTLRVDPTGEGEEVPEYDDNDPIPYAVAPATTGGALQADLTALPATLQEGRVATNAIKPADVGRSDFIYDCPVYLDFDYERALYWPALTTSTTAWNYGSTTTYGVYKAATGYVAPEGGFNISHVYSVMHPYGLDNKDVTVEIYNGDPQVSDDILGRGTYHLGTVETPLYQNVQMMFKLDRPVYVSEGQRFYVVFTYPTGQEFPASLVKKQEALVSNRYLGYVADYGWFDVCALFNDNYGPLGYIATCLETVAGDAWVKVLTPDGELKSVLEGEILPGKSQDIDVRLTAMAAPKEIDNKAMLVIKSNDPRNTVTNFPVYLDKNATPTVSVASSSTLVNEGETATVNATVTDRDGDDLTLSLVTTGPAASFQSVTADDADITIDQSRREATVKGANGPVAVTVELSPVADEAGDHALTIAATDSYGHEGQGVARFTVAHVNRAPEAKSIENVTVALGGASSPIAFTDLFTDPDGDELTYDLKAQRALVEFYYTDKGFVVVGLKKGTTRVTATATDPSGAKATMQFGVTVSDLGGVEQITMIEGVTYYPNPVVESLYIVAEQSVGAVDCEIYALGGKLAAKFDGIEIGTTPCQINLSTLAPGAYAIRLTAKSGAVATGILLKE